MPLRSRFFPGKRSQRRTRVLDFSGLTDKRKVCIESISVTVVFAGNKLLLCISLISVVSKNLPKRIPRLSFVYPESQYLLVRTSYLRCISSVILVILIQLSYLRQLINTLVEVPITKASGSKMIYEPKIRSQKFSIAKIYQTDRYLEQKTVQNVDQS